MYLSLKEELKPKSLLFHLGMIIILCLVFSKSCTKNKKNEEPIYTKLARALVLPVSFDTATHPLQKPFSKKDSSRIINGYVNHFNDTSTFVGFNKWLYGNMVADKYDNLKTVLLPLFNAYLNQSFIRDSSKLFKR